MKMEIKVLRKTNSRKPLDLLSQKEIFRRINKSTRNSYRYLDLLIWKGAANG